MSGVSCPEPASHRAPSTTTAALTWPRSGRCHCQQTWGQERTVRACSHCTHRGSAEGRTLPCPWHHSVDTVWGGRLYLARGLLRELWVLPLGVCLQTCAQRLGPRCIGSTHPRLREPLLCRPSPPATPGLSARLDLGGPGHSWVPHQVKTGYVDTVPLPPWPSPLPFQPQREGQTDSNFPGVRQLLGRARPTVTITLWPHFGVQ